MITENLSTLKINKLSREQYERELAAGRIDETALYLTPDEPIDLTPYATNEGVAATYETKDDASAKLADAKKYTDDVAAGKSDASHNHDDAYDAKGAADAALAAAKEYADANDADTKYGIVYDSENKKIKLVEGGTEVEIDATDFIKDGMIETVTIGDDNDLVITFNTVAGKENIVLPLDQLVDIYTGVEGARVKVTVASDKSISADLVAGSIGKNYLDDGVQASLAKADTALQAQDISNLATKTELQDVDAKFANYTTTTDLNTALNLKADKTQVATDIATAKQEAIDDAATKYEAIGVAKGLVDSLSNGQVKTNKEAIEAINNTENGILAQAKSYSDGKLATARTEISAEIDADVKVVADDLAGYKTSNNEALAGVKATADAAATKEYTDAELAKKVAKTDYEADKATFATKTELNGVDAKFANYKTAADQKLIDDAQDVEIGKKVDKVEGKSLISDTEIARLANVTNYDDTQVKADIAKKADAATMTTELGKKVDKVTGYSLVSDTEIARLAEVDNYDDTALAGRVTTAEGKITALETESAKHALKTDVEAVDAKFADYVTSASYTTDKQATTDALNARYTKTEADAKFAVKGEDSYDDTELAGRVSAIEADYLKAADKYNDTQVKADIKANADAIDAIEADYLKAADIANFETKENVKKVSDDLSAYKTSNDAAVDLKADKSVVDAMYTNEQIDAAILVETNRAKGVEESLQTQINTIMNNPDTEGVINSINEFTQYIADHGEIAEGFRTDIDANAKAIADHEALAAQTYETKIDAAQKLVDAKAYTDEQIAAIPATSWNDLTDKPFYDEGIAPITWDGVVGDRVTGSISSGEYHTQYVKVSDVILTVDELNTCTSIFSNGDSYSGGDYAQNFVVDGIVVYGDGSVFSVSTTDFTGAPDGLSMSFPETGTYFALPENGHYITSLTFEGGELKTLDDKFISDNIARVTDVEAAQAAAEAKAATAQAAAEAAQKTADDYATAHTGDYTNAQIDAAIKVNTDSIGALEDTVAGKADADHDHAIADVTGLQDALDGKLNANGWRNNSGAIISSLSDEDIGTVTTTLETVSIVTALQKPDNSRSVVGLCSIDAGGENVIHEGNKGLTIMELSGSGLDKGTVYGSGHIRYATSTDTTNILSFPEKSGTLALTSDITTLADNTYTKDEVDAAVEAAVTAATEWGSF